MKRMVIVLLSLFFFVASFSFPFLPRVEGESLSLSVMSDPVNIAIEGSQVVLTCVSNLDAFVSINILIRKRTIIFEENVPVLANTSKSFKVPVAYPIVDDFTILISAETIDSLASSSLTKQFSLRKRVTGIDKIKGRIISCSNQSKTGIENAKIEIISGPSIGSVYSEDDGYFVIDRLPKGVYKLGISHPCSTDLTEKIVLVDEKTPFIEACLSSYGIADFDFWLNKPSGSSFEIGETITFFLRSSLEMKVDLLLTNEISQHELFNNFYVSDNQIQTFYWTVPDYVSIGEYTLQLQPKDKNLCGTAEYKVNFYGELKKGTIQGKVLVEGIPLKHVEVYLPLQFNPHTFTDSFGNYEIKNVSPGIHTIRFLLEGFNQTDLRGVEVSQNQITEVTPTNLTPSDTIFQVFPNPILSITHERREKIVPLEISLIKGFAKKITVEAIDFPEGLSLSSNFIDTLAQEKELINILISDRILPNTYSITIRLKSDLAEIEIPGTITVAGLSFGTFDGLVLPKRNTIPQGYSADYIFRTNRFSNFNSPIQIKFINLPPYTKIVLKEEPAAPPFDFHFTLESTLSTPPGEYKILLMATADNQRSSFSFLADIIQAGATLSTVPESGWNPILEPGQRREIPIATYSNKGVSKNVRVNLDYGPNWLVVSNRALGNVSEQKVFAYLEFLPNETMQPGGYDYSISFSYGDRNEGYKKFSGRIYVLSVDPNIPSNLRAKFIEENKKIVLTWGPPSEDNDQVIGYNIYKSLHYSSLENAFPLNKSLIKEQYFEDIEYKIGKTYWYTVKAVKADGFISKQSNTAELSILTRDKINLLWRIDKGEKATYFVGEKLNLSLLSNTSGSMSLSIQAENFSVLLDQKEISKNIPYLLSYSVPDFMDDAYIIASFITSTGQKNELKKSITIKKNKSGLRTIKGELWNTNTNQPIANAKISTFEGSTRIKEETDEEGLFHINSLSDGSYRFLIETDSTKLVTEAYIVREENLDIGRINISQSTNQSLMAWTTSDLTLAFQSNQLFPLFIKSDVPSNVSISVNHDWIERILITNKEVQANRVYCEKLKLPEDVPTGYSFLTIRDLVHDKTISLRIFVEEPVKGIWGKVKDVYDAPINKANVSGTTTNEWGFFYLSETSNDIEIHKKNFVSLKLDKVEFSLNHTAIMPMDLGSVSTLQSQLSVAGDFNDFSFTFFSINGISNHFQIKIDPETTTYESPIFDVFPDYIYQFSYNNLLQEQIHAESNLIFIANGVSKTIKLIKGPKDKIFLETDPEIIVVDRDQENMIILDLYSYGNYKRNFVLSAVFWNDIIKSSFEPVTIIPGNNTSFRFTIPTEQEPGIYYFLIQATSDLFNFEFPYTITILDKNLSTTEKEWNTTLYEKSTDTFDFYLSKKPKSIKIENIIQELSYDIKDQSITFKINKNENKTIETEVKVILNQNQTISLKINIEFIPMEQWVAPTISLSSQQEGIRILISKNGYDQHFLINKSSEPGVIQFLNKNLVSSSEFIDKQVKNYQKYFYSLFSTNGRLEAGWSNQQEITYNQLSLTMDLKENTITNVPRFLLTGSISIGATLTINQQLVIIEKNGFFKTYFQLKEGKNVLLFQVEDLFQNRLDVSRTVFLDTMAPPIKMIDPLELEINTLQKTYVVRFESEEDVHMTVNSEKILPKRDAYYELVCVLEQGSNTFLIVANDKAGNQKSLKIQINLFQRKISITLQIGNREALIDQKKNMLEVPPMIIQGRTLVPLRFIADGFGATIDWNAATKEIVILQGKKSIKLQVGSKKAIINSTQWIDLEVPPMIIQGRTLVPLRFIADGFGATIDWNAATKEIVILFWQPF